MACFSIRVLLKQTCSPKQTPFHQAVFVIENMTYLKFHLQRWLTSVSYCIDWRGTSPLSLLFSGLLLCCLNASSKVLQLQCHFLVAYSSCYNFPGVTQNFKLSSERTLHHLPDLSLLSDKTSFCTNLPKCVLLPSLHSFLAVLIAFSCHWKIPFSVFVRHRSTLHQF